MRALLAVSLLALVAPAAHAVPVRYDFTISLFQVQGTPPGAGSADGSGYVMFDTDLAALADSSGQLGNSLTPLPTLGLSFDWLGMHFDTTNGTLSALSFDELGNPYAWDIDGTPSSGCGFRCVQWGTDDFSLVATGSPGSPVGGDGLAILAQAGVSGLAIGLVSWTMGEIRGVPEPGTFGLLALGIAGIALRRRKSATA